MTDTDTRTSPERIDQLADRLTAATPPLDAAEQRIALTLLGQLTLGAPVTTSQLAAVVDVPEAQVADALERLPTAFRDDRDRVVGFMGLTIQEMGQHRIELDGRTLWAWCAWDTLFLPELLGATAHVTSREPGSDAEISLTVTREAVTDLSPAQAVVSLLLPHGEFDANVIQRFCRFVHFFASPQAGAAWTAEHPGTFLLSVEDAHRLGRLTNRARFGAAIAGSRQ